MELEYCDEHESGQLRLGVAGDQRELLPLVDAGIPSTGEMSLVDRWDSLESERRLRNALAAGELARAPKRLFRFAEYAAIVAGTCDYCGGRFRRGAQIAYEPLNPVGHKVLCPECFASLDEAHGSGERRCECGAALVGIRVDGARELHCPEHGRQAESGE